MQLMSGGVCGGRTAAASRLAPAAAVRPPFTTAAGLMMTRKRPAAPPPSSPPAARPSPAAFRRDDAGFVEEEDDMVVLRRRIHEVRAAECYWRPPAGWAAWEKEWYEHGGYDASVRELVGALRAFLLRSRPAVAAVALGVPATALLLAGQLLDAARALVSSLQN